MAVIASAGTSLIAGKFVHGFRRGAAVAILAYSRFGLAAVIILGIWLNV
jgi:hypothetical protein